MAHETDFLPGDDAVVSTRVNRSVGWTVEVDAATFDPRVWAVMSDQMFLRPFADLREVSRGHALECRCPEDRNNPLCWHSQSAQWRACREEPIWAQLAYEMDLHWDTDTAHRLFFQHEHLALWPYYDSLDYPIIPGVTQMGWMNGQPLWGATDPVASLSMIWVYMNYARNHADADTQG